MDALTALRFPQIPAGLDAARLQQVAAPKIPAQELSSIGGADGAGMRGLSTVEPGRSFSDLLGEMVRDVGAKQATAGDAMRGVLSNEGVPLHQAVIAAEEASVSFQLMVEVRNKLLESYQELMRMQI
jgi:flagellar hook-basal body complex protein FliE